MILNYILIALRNIKKNKTFSIINILGLAFGLACSILIILWVNDERSYDSFHKDIERIHLAMVNMGGTGTQVQIWHTTPGPLAPALKDEIPEIEEIARIDTGFDLLFQYEDKTFKEKGGFCDPSFFRIFNYPLQSGDYQTAFENPLSIVISESIAEKYFGDQDPIGKVIKVFDREVLDLTVTGVFEPLPGNSTLRFDYLIPYQTYENNRPYMKTWSEYGLLTFIKLDENADLDSFNDKIDLFISSHNGQEGSTVSLFFYPFRDYYLKSNVKSQKDATGRITYVYLFTVIAIIILVIACINFMNLSTARAGKRSREVGIRKVSGARKENLIIQFLGESIGMTFISGVVALTLADLLLPLFNYVTTKDLTIPYDSPEFILSYLIILVFTGLVAGSYPAFFLSGFKPSQVLKGSTSEMKSMGGSRRALVIFQFSLSTVLIISTIIVHNQMQFLLNKDLGINTSNVVYHGLTKNIRANYEAFYNELNQIPGVESYTRSNFDPLNILNSTYSPTWQGKPDDSDIQFHVIQTASNFIETMDIELLEGRNLPEWTPGDSSIYFLINEETARVMGNIDPIGMEISFWGLKGTVVGIIENFHHHALFRDIEPVIVMRQQSVSGYNLVRISPGMTQETLAAIEALYSKYEPEYPFEFKFLEQEHQSRYSNVSVAGTLTNIFAFIAIAISCLGLFGLTSYMTDQRKKETGIRKALGASVERLTIMFSTDFIKLVLISILLAVPVAYFITSNWLGNFAYRIELKPIPFITGGFISILIAVITVTYHTIKASKANPIDSLRYE